VLSSLKVFNNKIFQKKIPEKFSRKKSQKKIPEKFSGNGIQIKIVPGKIQENFSIYFLYYINYILKGYNLYK
jgi:hypothetical protein